MEQATASHSQRDIETSWYRTYISLENKKQLEITIVALFNFTFLSGIFILFIVGGTIYAEEHPKELTYKQHSCLVYNTDFRQYRCSSKRPLPICFVPVWNIGYGQNEIVNATIVEDNRYKTMPEAIKRAEDYPIGSSFICWCDSENPSLAQWERPDARIGIFLMFFGGLTTVLTIVSLLLIYRFCKKVIKQEEEEIYGE